MKKFDFRKKKIFTNIRRNFSFNGSVPLKEEIKKQKNTHTERKNRIKLEEEILHRTTKKFHTLTQLTRTPHSITIAHTPAHTHALTSLQVSDTFSSVSRCRCRRRRRCYSLVALSHVAANRNVAGVHREKRICAQKVNAINYNKYNIYNQIKCTHRRCCCRRRRPRYIYSVHAYI